MAGDSYTLSYNLAGEGQVVRGIRNMDNATKRLRTSTGGLSGGLKGLAGRFVGLQLAANYAMQKGREVIKWVQDAIKSFREFDKSIAEVSTILTSLNMKYLPALSAGIENLSVKFGKSATDLARGMYDILSSAIEAKEGLRLLNIATKASVAGITDVKTSVDVFTSILKSYGKTVNQAGQISDTLFQTVVRGKLRFEDLASAMGYITPIAANLGVSFDEVAAALSTVTRQGLHVDMASRGLALALQNIANPTQQAAKAAQEYDVAMDGLTLRVKGLQYFITELNTATEEYGMKIIPEMIRNMRSLRVIMALAGDEGIAGFTEDLNLLATSSGKTEEAMSKMMKTAKMQADILDQSMKMLERDIGAAWHGFDIWIKKAQLWWGTFLSGGDATKAVAGYDDRILDMQRHYVEMVAMAAKFENKQPLIDLIVGAEPETDIGALIAYNTEMDKLSDFFTLSQKKSILSEETQELTNQRDAAIVVHKEMQKTAKEIYGTGIQVKTIFDTISDVQDVTDPAMSMDFANSVKVKGESVATMTKEIDDNLDTLTGWQEQLDALDPEIQYIMGGIDSLSERIRTHKTNIMELNVAIKGLNTEIRDSYTSFGGNEFEGKLNYQLAVQVDEAKLSRFTTMTSMATKYGTEYLDTYIAKYGELDTELGGAISTIYNYNEAAKEQAEAQTILKDTLDEYTRSIRLNSMEAMKIQIKGMTRRRGLTRSEEKILKKLQIENMQFRIDSMDAEFKHEEQYNQDTYDLQKEAYEAASDFLQRYIDDEQFNLTLLKDIRDDDIRDLELTIEDKEKKLEDYKEFYEEELASLKIVNDAYVEAMTLIGNDPTLADAYEEYFGINAIDEATQKLKDYKEFLEDFSETPSPIGGGGGAGGGTSGGGGSGGEEPPALPYNIVSHYFRKMREGLWAGFATSSSGVSRRAGNYPSEANAQSGTAARWAIGSGVGWKRGTHYVPHDQPYMLHRGEQVSPAGSNDIGGDNFNIYITNHNTINNEMDVEHVVALMAEGIQTRLTDKTGRSKYRFR